MSHRRIYTSLLCPYVKVFVLFKTARRQEEKKQLDPWIVPPASGSHGSASGLLSPIKPANSARASELDKVACRGKEMSINRLNCVLSVGVGFDCITCALCFDLIFPPHQVAASQLASTLASRVAN